MHFWGLQHHLTMWFLAAKFEDAPKIYQFWKLNKIFSVAGFQKMFFSEYPHRLTRPKVWHFWSPNYHSFWYIAIFEVRAGILAFLKNFFLHLWVYSTNMKLGNFKNITKKNFSIFATLWKKNLRCTTETRWDILINFCSFFFPPR